MEDLRVNAFSIKYPICVLHGTDDHICDISGSKEFVEAVQSPDKKLIMLDGFYHEIFNEIEFAQAFSHVLEFLEERL